MKKTQAQPTRKVKGGWMHWVYTSIIILISFLFVFFGITPAIRSIDFSLWGFLRGLAILLLFFAIGWLLYKTFKSAKYERKKYLKWTGAAVVILTLFFLIPTAYELRDDKKEERVEQVPVRDLPLHAYEDTVNLVATYSINDCNDTMCVSTVHAEETIAARMHYGEQIAWWDSIGSYTTYERYDGKDKVQYFTPSDGDSVVVKIRVFPCKSIADCSG